MYCNLNSIYNTCLVFTFHCCFSAWIIPTAAIPVMVGGQECNKSFLSIISMSYMQKATAGHKLWQRLTGIPLCRKANPKWRILNMIHAGKAKRKSIHNFLTLWPNGCQMESGGVEAKSSSTICSPLNCTGVGVTHVGKVWIHYVHWHGSDFYCAWVWLNNLVQRDHLLLSWPTAGLKSQIHFWIS